LFYARDEKVHADAVDNELKAPQTVITGGRRRLWGGGERFRQMRFERMGHGGGLTRTLCSGPVVGMRLSRTDGLRFFDRRQCDARAVCGEQAGAAATGAAVSNPSSLLTSRVGAPAFAGLPCRVTLLPARWLVASWRYQDDAMQCPTHGRAVPRNPRAVVMLVIDVSSQHAVGPDVAALNRLVGAPKIAGR